MKKYIRYILYGILIYLGLSLWQAYVTQFVHPVTNYPSKEIIQSQKSNINQDEVSQKLNTVNSKNKSNVYPTKAIDSKNIITVTTDLFKVEINRQGGDIIQVTLFKYLDDNKTKPLTLLNDDQENFYVSQSGIYPLNGFKSLKDTLDYQAEDQHYQIENGEKTSVVVLTATNKEGIKIVKTYTFQKGSYLINIDYKIINKTKNSWTGRYYAQFDQIVPDEEKRFLSIHPFEGIAILDDHGSYERFYFKQLKTHPLEKIVTGGWLAVSQRYFVSAWIPESNINYRYYSQIENENFYVVGFTGPRLQLKPGESIDIKSKIYSGPKISEYLRQAAPKLDLTVDYSSFALLSLLAAFLFSILKFINHFVGNWGFSIILITILIKLVFYHLSTTSYKSMAALKTLQPKMEEIKKRYKDNVQERNKAMMELYKTEKINPLGGCLPIVVQIPVFIALYYVLLQSVELRQAPFIFWIQDLSSKDPYYILPVLMGASMWAQQKLTPTADPTQAKMMMFLPLFLTVLFLNFPAGLVLYWLTNNILSIVQQWYINRNYELSKSKKKRGKNVPT